VLRTKWWTFSAYVITSFNKINITIVIFLLIPRILNSPFSVLQLSLNVTFVAIVQNYRHALTVPAPASVTNSMDRTILKINVSGIWRIVIVSSIIKMIIPINIGRRKIAFWKCGIKATSDETNSTERFSRSRHPIASIDLIFL
jgi:hypothetical protein